MDDRWRSRIADSGANSHGGQVSRFLCGLQYRRVLCARRQPIADRNRRIFTVRKGLGRDDILPTEVADKPAVAAGDHRHVSNVGGVHPLDHDFEALVRIDGRRGGIFQQCAHRRGAGTTLRQRMIAGGSMSPRTRPLSSTTGKVGCSVAGSTSRAVASRRLAEPGIVWTDLVITSATRANANGLTWYS